MESSRDFRNEAELDVANKKVHRISSYPANFETKLENDSLTNQPALPLHMLVNICAKECHLEDDNDVNLTRFGRTNEHNGEFTVAVSSSPDGRLSSASINKSPSSCAAQHERPLSPFSIMTSVPWFSSRDQEDCTEQLAQADRRDECVDDDVSVKSEAYYEPMDFDTSNWMKASMNVPTVGLAILAVSTAIAHPLFFFFGALTAFGTATAAAKGYGYFFNYDEEQSSIWQHFCLGGVSNSLGTNNDQDIKTKNGNTSNYTLPAIHFENDDNGDGSSLPTTSDSSFNNHLATECDATKSGHTSENTVMNESQPNNLQALSTQIESCRNFADNWVELNYPALKNTVIKDCPFVGLNTVEFFRVFLDDDAPYNFRVFQEKRGDIDIQYGDWRHLPESGLSLLPLKSGNNFPNGLEYHSFQGRVLSFKARTNSLLGPPWATTKKTQRMLILTKRLAVLECRTDLSDIPFCDKFFVMERWVLKATKELDRYITYMTATSEVYFTGYCAFESQIRSKTAASMRDIIASWYVMATEALKLTEQSKLDRLNNSHMEGSEIERTESVDKNTKVSSENVTHRRICSNDSIEISDWIESSQKAESVETSLIMKTDNLLPREPKIPVAGFKSKGSMWMNLRRSKIPTRPVGLKS